MGGCPGAGSSDSHIPKIHDKVRNGMSEKGNLRFMVNQVGPESFFAGEIGAAAFSGMILVQTSQILQRMVEYVFIFMFSYTVSWILELLFQGAVRFVSSAMRDRPLND